MSEAHKHKYEWKRSGDDGEPGFAWQVCKECGWANGKTLPIAGHAGMLAARAERDALRDAIGALVKAAKSVDEMAYAEIEQERAAGTRPRDADQPYRDLHAALEVIDGRTYQAGSGTAMV